jgi:ribonuclease HII
MDLSAVTLVEVRERFDRADSRITRGRIVAALLRDPRRGARALGERLARRARADRDEERRLRDLFARQVALEAAGAGPVAGVDEVGVGPLAGPVVAAAVVLPAVGSMDGLRGLDDSKRLSRIARERLAGEIRRRALSVGVAEVAPAEVDALNVYRASLEAMRRAVTGLAESPGHLLVDARRVPGVAIPQTPLVGGDGSEACIAAASIVAKVHRDALMRGYEEMFPGYGFAKHKGYGTAAHLAALRRLGPSALHRRSFAPVAQLELIQR